MKYLSFSPNPLYVEKHGNLKIKFIVAMILISMVQMLSAQGNFKLEPFFKYQEFKNFDQISTFNPIVDATSNGGNNIDFGLNILFKNTGLKLEAGSFHFKSQDNIRDDGTLFDHQFVFPVNGVSGAGQGEYGFNFNSYSFSLIHHFNINRFRVGLSAGYGSLSTKKTDDGTSLMYVVFANNSQEDYSYRLAYEFSKGDRFLTGLELAYNLMDRFVIFTGLNYSQGSFKHSLNKEESINGEPFLEFDSTKMKFKTLGLSIGLAYSFSL